MGDKAFVSAADLGGDSPPSSPASSASMDFLTKRIATLQLEHGQAIQVFEAAKAQVLRIEGAIIELQRLLPSPGAPQAAE